MGIFVRLIGRLTNMVVGTADAKKVDRLQAIHTRITAQKQTYARLACQCVVARLNSGIGARHTRQTFDFLRPRWVFRQGLDLVGLRREVLVLNFQEL